MGMPIEERSAVYFGRYTKQSLSFDVKSQFVVGC